MTVTPFLHDEGMNTNELLTAFPAAADEPVADPTGQLLLLPEPTLAESAEHARFRLSKETRERGLRHVAEIRARLAAAKSTSTPNNVVTLSARRQPAA